MKLRLCVVLCLVALHSAQSPSKLRSCSSKQLYMSVDRIYGGWDARPLEFPHQVSLQIRWLNSHVCGGTLIADNWVLTAAHCFVSRGAYPYNWQAVLGEHSLRRNDTTERTFKVDEIFIHENYNPQNQVNDIALVKLEDSVALTGTDRHIKTICLADKSFVVRSGYQCVVTGWGKGDKDPRLTDVLQKLVQPLLSWQQCANAWKGVGWPVTEKNVCVGDLKSQIGVCSGDSGGPVQCRLKNGGWMQVGVTSWTTGGCTVPGYAAVFTSVASYLDWANEIINSY